MGCRRLNWDGGRRPCRSEIVRNDSSLQLSMETPESSSGMNSLGRRRRRFWDVLSTATVPRLQKIINSGSQGASSILEDPAGRTASSRNRSAIGAVKGPYLDAVNNQKPASTNKGTPGEQLPHKRLDVQTVKHQGGEDEDSERAGLQLVWRSPNGTEDLLPYTAPNQSPPA